MKERHREKLVLSRANVKSITPMMFSPWMDGMEEEGSAAAKSETEEEAAWGEGRKWKTNRLGKILGSRSARAHSSASRKVCGGKLAALAGDRKEGSQRRSEWGRLTWF